MSKLYALLSRLYKSIESNRVVYTPLLLAAVLLLVLTAILPPPDDFSCENIFWNGLSILRERTNAAIIDTRGLENLNGGAAVLLIGPSHAFSEDDASVVQGFLARGGLLVAADDFGTLNKLLDMLGINVTITGQLLEDPLFNYNSPLLPQVEVRIGETNYTIYYNYGSVLIVNDDRCECIGSSSILSYIDANGNMQPDPGEPRGTFCVAALCRIGGGAMLVLSDSSVFINSMIVLGDTEKLVLGIVGNRSVYIIGDKWSHSLYYNLHAAVRDALRLALHTSLRYPAALLTAYMAYSLVRRTPILRLQRHSSARAGR